jgi:hypothetical protein
MSVAEPVSEGPARVLRSLQATRMAKVFWLVAIVALLLMFFSLARSPLPWLDEALISSTSLSMVRGGPPVPTVMGAFPHTSRFDLFYGPLYCFSARSI